MKRGVSGVGGCDYCGALGVVWGGCGVGVVVRDVVFVKTTAVFRALDQLSGVHRPSKFFAANAVADEQVAELARLREQVESVRALHKLEGGETPTGEYADMCYECQDYWPCPTVALLDGVQAL